MYLKYSTAIITMDYENDQWLINKENNSPVVISLVPQVESSITPEQSRVR